MPLLTDPSLILSESNTTKWRKPRTHFIHPISEPADPNPQIPPLTQSTGCKSSISSLLSIPTNPKEISANHKKKKSNFPSTSFRGFGCTAGAAQRVSVPRAIRASAEWEGKRMRRKKKQRSARQRKDLSGSTNGGKMAADLSVVVQDAWCGPGIGYGGGDGGGGSVDCVVARRNVGSSARGKIDGEKISQREPSCLARRAVNLEPLSFLGSDPPLTRRGSDLVGTRYYRHVRHPSPDGFAEIMMLQSSLLMGGRLDAIDRFRDWRLDVDNMTYEELLELGEKIGYVNTGLREDEIGRCVRKSNPSNDLLYLPTQMELKCSICQEEYEADDEMGKLHCGHGYHIKCIKQWLAQKNTCPVCKADGVARY